MYKILRPNKQNCQTVLTVNLSPVYPKVETSRVHPQDFGIFRAVANLRLTDALDLIEQEFSCSPPQALDILHALQWGGMGNV